MSEQSQQQQQSPAPIPRLGFFPNLIASFKQIRSSVNEEGNRIRKSDPWTIWLVPGLAVGLACAAATHGLLSTLVAAAALFAALLYIAARIGIVRSMNSRQVNLVWHIILAAFLAGILFAFLLVHLMGLIE